jgi:glycosyltransferase involved in cell wall biosynthesis
LEPGRSIALPEISIPLLTIASDRWDEARGGREAYLCALARSAADAGHEVAFVRVRPGDRVAPTGGPVLAAVPVEGATHYQLHSGLFEDAFEAERRSLRSRVRRTLFRPGLRLNRFRSSLLSAEGVLLSAPNRPRLMAFSEALCARIERRFGGADVAVERPGVDTDRFRPAPNEIPARDARVPLRLLFVAHNFELKGLRALLEALSVHLAHGRHASLTVVGAGPVARFRRAAARIGLSRAVTFAGSVPQEEMPDCYRGHDALIHPTYYDPFSLVAAEALASGIPVVTTRCNGAAEVLRDGREGYVLDQPEDAAALVAILDSLQDPDTRATMRGNAVLLGQSLDARAHFGRVLRWLEPRAAGTAARR